PWGFYFYFDPAQTAKFAKEFFDGVELKGIDTNLPLQPKVLVVEPQKRLSWQYHHRRAEIWRCITGNVLVSNGTSDEEPGAKLLKFGEIINNTNGTRHRLASTKEWGAVVEI